MARRYRNSPLIEVVCTITFDAESQWDLAVPGLIYSELKDAFPVRRSAAAINMGLIQSSAGASVGPSLNIQPRIQLINKAGTALVQVGQNLLAINHLKPYPGYDTYAALIQRAYSAYRDNAHPHAIQSLELKYINRLEIPKNPVEIEEYLTFYPHVGEELPKDYQGFTVGIQVSEAEGRDLLQVQLVSAQNSSPSTSAMILELTYSLVQASSVGLDEVMSWVDAGHTRVKQSFEAAIIDELRRLFEPEGEG